MVFVAIQLDRQAAIDTTLHHKVDCIAAHGYLGSNAKAEIEQATTEISLKVGLAKVEHLLRPDYVGLHRRAEVLDQRQLQIAGFEIARGHREHKNQPVAGPGSGDV